jgi:hypothetical protein
MSNESISAVYDYDEDKWVLRSSSGSTAAPAGAVAAAAASTKAERLSFYLTKQQKFD